MKTGTETAPTKGRLRDARIDGAADNGSGDCESETTSGDDHLVLALAAGASVREAAEQAGIGERTVYRRLSGPEFRRRVSQARGRLFDSALGKLASVASKAAATLERLMESDKPSVALGAAKAALELGPRLREATELEERLNRLESVAHQNERIAQTSAANSRNGH